jgi:ATP phosphoribosyltransferase regulatory subunit
VRISTALPAGVSALLFGTAQRRRALESGLAEALLSAGFGEVILPILDYLEPYEPLLSPSGRGELYRFSDRDGQLLVLRADSTPMLARLLAPRLSGLELPLRLFYRGDVVRYEEERAGRAREYYELGAELLGAPGPDAEIEMMGRCVELILGHRPAAGSPPRVEVVVGFAGALDALLLEATPERAASLATAVSRRERSTVRQAAAPLLTIVERGVPKSADDLGPASAGRLRTLEAQVQTLSSRFPQIHVSIDLAEFATQTRDPRLAATPGHARPYYDGVVFQVYADGSALPVASGGRYDELFRRLGAEVSAVGFAIGLDRLLETGGRS